MNTRPETQEDALVVGESRWPMAGAVLAVMVLTILLPEDTRTLPQGLIPAIEGVLLIALIAADPGKIDRRSRELRWLSIGLVSILTLSSLAATGQLIEVLINGGKETNSASELLAAGTIIWTANIIAFSLLYWELDSGGAAARAHNLRRHPDFAFPQQMNPDLAPRSWRPRYIDYLYLGFTNATAFSPTDTMPMPPWAKIAMAVQAFASIAILGLVIARAVNVFA
jgi:hypothetical protein